MDDMTDTTGGDAENWSDGQVLLDDFLYHQWSKGERVFLTPADPGYIKRYGTI